MIHSHVSVLDNRYLNDEQFVVYHIMAVIKYFKHGVSDGASEYGKRFFKVFVEALKASKDRLVDSYWATEVIECNDYLKMVLEKNFP